MEQTRVLRVERLEELAGVLADAIAAVPIDLGGLPPTIAAAAKAAKWAGIDVADLARTTVVDSLRRLPTVARSDPDRADAITAWAVHAVAWLAGQTDAPPPALELA